MVIKRLSCPLSAAESAVVKQITTKLGLADNEDVVRLACWWLAVHCDIPMDPFEVFVIGGRPAKRIRPAVKSAEVHP